MQAAGAAAVSILSSKCAYTRPAPIPALGMNRGRLHLATSEQRARPRKAGTPKAAKAAPRKTSATAKKSAPARKAVAAKKAVAPKKKTAAPRAVKPAAVKSVAKPRAKKKVDPTERLRDVVIDALDGLKAKDVQEIDVRGKSSVADLMVVASGTSTRHVKSLADEVVKKAKQSGLPPIGVEGQREGEWVLVDLGDVIVHVMLPRTREFYGLERLWTVGDAEYAAAV